MRTVTDLQEIQGLAISILHAFINYCKEYGLTYYLAYGTLIGAIRHHGFIPWDDDIDVWMPRKDFDTLCHTFPNWGASRGFYINCAEQTAGYDRAHAQICLANTHLIMHGRKTAYSEGYFIDVFPLDGAPASTISRWIRLTQMQLLKNIGTMYSYDSNDHSIRGKILRLGNRVFKTVDVQKIMKRYNIIARKTQLDFKNGYIQMTHANSGGRNMVLPSTLFSESISEAFEDMQCSIPVGYDTILQRLYGDYMTLPPKEKRIPHHSFDLEIED